MTAANTWDLAAIDEKLDFAQNNFNTLFSGYEWSKKTITFSFPSTAFPGTGSYLPDGEALQYTPFSQAEIDLTLAMFDMLERFIDIDFVYQADGSGDIKIGHQNMTAGGYADYPYVGSDHAVLISDDLPIEDLGYGIQALVHELGHSLGLEHPHETTTPLSDALDLNTSTIMSYDRLTLNGGESHRVITFMPMDILALQAMYGVSKKVSDDVYAADGSISVIADQAGFDTIDISTQTYDLNDVNIIDLEQGFVYYDRRNGGWQSSIYDDETGTWTDWTPRSADNGFYNMIIMPGSTIEKVVGSAVADQITGTSEAESLFGLAGDDEIGGGGGIDHIEGGDGSDTIDGGAGADTMFGGTSDDVFYVDDAGDVVVEESFEGRDRVIASIDYTLQNYVEILELAGAAIGGTGDDLANAVIGNTLDNILSGGLGKDMLTGRAGADQFGFASSGEAGKGRKSDTITDFARGEDVIDISAILPAGEFDFVGRRGFGGIEGELRAFRDNNPGKARDATYIQGDMDGNGIADFQIKLLGLFALQDSDFVL
jgi:Ca2+-binding RTX toxin-like protein